MADPVITSRLWKANQLVNNSTYFPAMVEAAAFYEKKTYTQHLLRTVSTNVAIVDALVLPVDGTVDAVLAALMQTPTGGAAVDAAITAAVKAYVPPAGV